MSSAIVASAVVLAVLAIGACRRQAPSPGPADRPWTTADFQRVAATKGCGGLPAFDSPAFARMTDPDVLATIAPRERAFAERFEALMEYQDALRTIFKRYATACADLRAFLVTSTVLIELAAHQLPLLDEFLAGFSPADPTYATRVGGLEQVKQGLVAMATGTAITVRGTDFTAPLPGVGVRLGAAIARAQALLPPGALAAAIGNLEVPEDLDDNPHRRALRAEIRAGLTAPLPAP